MKTQRGQLGDTREDRLYFKLRRDQTYDSL